MVRLLGYSKPTENIHHTENDTSLNVDGNEVGLGTLYITESNVVWLNPREEGVELEYKLISLHAVSRDLASFPHEHLLLHYEGNLPGLNETTNQSNEEEEEEREEMECPTDDGRTLIEIRFVPQNKESLNGLFEAMSNCQVLHPDPDDDCVSEEEFEDADELEGGDGFYTSEEGLSQLTEEGQANLERFNAMLRGQGGQGDADITARTSQITITNGHHDPEDDSTSPDQGQFQDAEGMDQ